jgi:phosphatidylglycerol---prolipoprotein diacylglyceryl transferase
VLLLLRPKLSRESGLQFKLLLAGYLLWRLLIDGLKPVPYEFAGGLSGIQLVCAVALVLYLPFLVRQLSRLRT